MSGSADCIDCTHESRTWTVCQDARMSTAFVGSLETSTAAKAILQVPKRSRRPFTPVERTWLRGPWLICGICGQPVAVDREFSLEAGISRETVRTVNLGMFAVTLNAKDVLIRQIARDAGSLSWRRLPQVVCRRLVRPDYPQEWTWEQTCGFLTQSGRTSKQTDKGFPPLQRAVLDESGTI